jgi:hypothetical protein
MAHYFQTPAEPFLSRQDHVWVGRKADWICCLCGAVTSETPPPCPTSNGWMPERYEPLTGKERALCPEPFRQVVLS